MAFFAVVGDNDKSFEVLQCHINLWCLGGILGHYNFVWDVGLRLKGKEGQGPISKIHLAFPFGTADGSLEDLGEKLTHQGTEELVFGNPVQFDGNNIKYDDSPVTVGRVDSTKRIEDKCGTDYSFWEVAITPSIVFEQEVYIRLRARVVECGNTWAWRKSLWRKNGALIDLRVADVREAVAIGAWGALRNRIVPITSMNLLVIAPDFLQLRAVSPTLRYMRLLESRAWEHYLGQSPNSSRRRRLIIYHWKNEKVIDVNRPFLAFLDLSRDYGFVRPENHIRSALVIVLVGGLAQVYAIDIGRAMGSWAIHLARENSVLTTLSGLGVGTAIYGIRNGWPLIRDIVAWCKISFLAVERKYLKSKRH